MTTIKFEAFFNTETLRACHARASANFATDAEARAFVASFPKSLGMKLGRTNDGSGFAYFDASFAATKGNGTNETGIKRARKLLADPRVTFVKGYARNAFDTEAEFLAAL